MAAEYVAFVALFSFFMVMIFINRIFTEED